MFLVSEHAKNEEVLLGEAGQVRLLLVSTSKVLSIPSLCGHS